MHNKCDNLHFSAWSSYSFALQLIMSRDVIIDVCRRVWAPAHFFENLRDIIHSKGGEEGNDVVKKIQG